MKHPFIKSMPKRLDWKIRWRIFRAGVRQQYKVLGSFGIGLALPVAAMWMFLLVTPLSPTPSSVEPLALVAEIRLAQQQEEAVASEGIYHVKRIITEGIDKPDFVALQEGEVVSAPQRVDVVETWQHSDTALALINSNATKKPFEAFLSREHDGKLALHHFGSGEGVVPSEREAYDQAHDLASLYTDFRSLNRPAIPVLSASATLARIDTTTNRAWFTERVNDTIIIESAVDLNTKLVVEEIIYVIPVADERYEMTRITYEGRQVLPAEQFEEIFNPSTFPYEQVAEQELS
jgi:hypothetical protein